MSKTHDQTAFTNDRPTTLAVLGAEERYAEWLAYLHDLGPLPTPVTVPEGDALLDAFRDLNVPADDIETLVRLRPWLDADQDLTWLLERCVHSLRANMDVVTTVPGFPVLPAEIGPIANFFYLYVYATMLPFSRELHRQHGIQDDTSSAIFADVGRNMLVHRKRHGTHGLAAPDWLMLHFRGMIFQLGRLQFERAKIGGRTGTAIQAAGLPYKTGDPTLSVHIPDFSGPLTQEACDDSFAQARTFFPAHFPDEDVHIAVCNSWLLDEQLSDYLSPGSNILAFQRRFQEIRPTEWNNTGILRFVFGPTDAPLDQRPQQTTVERAVVEHIRAGKEWHGGMGWMVFR